jgi:hypothetical protein
MYPSQVIMESLDQVWDNIEKKEKEKCHQIYEKLFSRNSCSFGNDPFPMKGVVVAFCALR